AARRRGGLVVVGDRDPGGMGCDAGAFRARVQRGELGAHRGRAPHRVRRAQVEDALSAVVAPSPRGVAVGDIERELRRLWAEAATARGETATTRALMAHVVVFCRSDGELFGGLEALADQVIYDSFGWPDPLRQLVVVARWIGGGASVAADLAWRRPRLWRRVIAETLDQALAPGAFEAISEVRIEHGPH